MDWACLDYLFLVSLFLTRFFRSLGLGYGKFDRLAFLSVKGMMLGSVSIFISSIFLFEYLMSILLWFFLMLC